MHVGTFPLRLNTEGRVSSFVFQAIGDKLYDLIVLLKASKDTNLCVLCFAIVPTFLLFV